MQRFFSLVLSVEINDFLAEIAEGFAGRKITLDEYVAKEAPYLQNLTALDVIGLPKGLLIDPNSPISTLQRCSNRGISSLFSAILVRELLCV